MTLFAKLNPDFEDRDEPPAHRPGRRYMPVVCVEAER